MQRTRVHPRPRAALVAAVTALLLALALAGCGGVAADGSDGPDAASPVADGFPLTIENCGRSVTVEAPPERVFAYYQHPAEMLVALGLEDSVVGYAYPDNAPLAEQREAYDALPLVSEQGASFEQVVATEPDLVYGGYASTFAEAQGRSRDAFEDAGIATYLTGEECADGSTEMEELYAEIETLGRVFAVPDRAADLVARLRGEVAEVEERLAGVEPLSVFVYDSGEDAPLTVGGGGIADRVIGLAGGANVFGAVAQNFAQVSWEQVVRAAPDVIVLLDYVGTPSLEAKERFLLSRPELAAVPAVRDRRFATLTLQDTVLGVRAPLAVGALARQLHPALVP